MKFPPREIEIKLAITNDQWRRLRDQLKSQSEVEAAQPLEHRTLRSIYFDTPTWALRHAGLTLRLRQNGDQWIQTLKAMRSLEGGVSKSLEIEAEVETGEPALGSIRDKEWRRKVTHLVRPGNLVPVFETAIERLIARRSTADGATIEIALDRGTISANGRKENVREIELELKSGQPDALLEIVQEILSIGPLQTSRYNKAERGYRLAGDDGAETFSATKAERCDFTSRSATDAAMIQLCTVTTRHILHNVRVLMEADAPEAAHQVRVGLRRLRTLLRVLDSTLDPDTLDRLSSAARNMGRDVGQVRDIHVIVDELVAPLVEHAQIADGIEKLRQDLAGISLLRRKELLSKLASTEYSHLLIELGLFSDIVGARVIARSNGRLKHLERLATRTIRKLLRRVNRRGHHIEQLSVEGRHELRKAIKPLRYAIEFFATLYPKTKIERLLASTVEMQEALGYLNDVALAETLGQTISPELRGDAAAQRAIGAVVGWHAARADIAWSEIAESWQKFQRAAKLFGD